MRGVLARSVLLSALTACGAALPTEPVTPVWPAPQNAFTSDGGLQLLVHEDHSSPLVVVHVVYGTGSSADPAGANGLAHLVEHLSFRSRLRGEPLAQQLSRAGARFNAATRLDQTAFTDVARKEDLAALLEMEMWRLTHPLEAVTPDDVRVETQVALNETRERGGDLAQAGLTNEILRALFPAQHPLGHAIPGDEHTIPTLTLAEAQAFASTAYRPENCTVVVSGDVTPAEITALMGTWPAAVTERQADGRPRPHRAPLDQHPPPEPPAMPPGSPRHVLTAPVELPQVIVAWSLPGTSVDNHNALMLAETMLDETGDVSMITTAEGSFVIVSTAIGPTADENAVLKRLRARVVAASARGFTADGLRTIQRMAQGQLLRAEANPLGAAEALADHLLHTGRSDFFKERALYLAHASTSQVAAFWQRYLRADRGIEFVVRPDSGAPVTSETQETLGDREAPSWTDRRSRPEDLAGMGPDDIRRVAKPPGLGALPRLHLRNQLEVVAIPTPGAPLAHVDVVVPVGEATYRPYGLVGLTTAVSMCDCQDAPPLLDVGGRFDLVTSKLRTRLSIVVPDGNLANGLASISEQARCRTLGLYGDAIMRKVREEMMFAPRRQQRHAAELLWQALYPLHVFGTIVPDLLSLRNFDRRTADEILLWRFRPNGALAVVQSSQPPDKLQPLLEQFLGRWTPVAPPLPTPPMFPPALPARRTFQVTDHPGGKQTQVAIACRLPPLTADTLADYDVLETLVEAQASELRTSWGATYGLSAHVGFFPGAAHLILEGSIENAHVQAALSRLLGQLAHDAEAGPSAGIFTAARWDVARDFSVRFAVPTARVRAVEMADALGIPADAWDRYPEHLATASPAGIQALLGSCVGHEVVSLQGNRAALQSIAHALDGTTASSGTPNEGGPDR